jgi:hypothetical protein
LLLPVSNGTAITMTNPSILLPFYQDGPAIMVATLTNFSLQLVVASIDNKLLKSSTKTNNISAITKTSFLQLPKDNSAFMQISVPNDFPAITTSSFMQLYVPTMITSIPYPTNMTAGLAT